jgi:hypothetical protein
MIEIVLEIDEKVEADGGLILFAYGSTEGILERPLLPPTPRKLHVPKQGEEDTTAKWMNGNLY